MFFRLAAALLLFALAVQVPVFLNVHRSAYHNYDLGIYSQGIHELGWSSPNPWLSARQLSLFADHFDPILFLCAPFAKLFSPQYVAVTFEMLFVLSAAFFLFYLCRLGQLNTSAALLIFCLFLFNKGLIRAVQFPVHPGTWSVLPLVFAGAAIYLRKHRALFLTLTLLFLFKEEFPVAGLMLGLVYLIKKKYVTGVSIALWSILWIIAVFHFRPVWMGAHSDYTSFLSSQLTEQPLQNLKVYITDWTLSRRIIEIFVPFAPLVIWRVRNRMFPNWIVLSMALPMFLIRLISHWWLPHRSAPLATLVLLSLIPFGQHIRIPRKVYMWTVLLLLLVNGSTLKGAVRTYRGQPERFATTEARIRDLNLAYQYLSQHREGKVLLEGNLIPTLASRPRIYQIGGAQVSGDHSYRYVFVEKPPYGDPWPLSHERYGELIGLWRDSAASVIYESDHVFLAEGEFNTDR